MAIPARQRWVIYAVALALTLAVVGWAGGQDRAEPRLAVAYQAERLERPARAPSPAAGEVETLLEVRLDQLERRAAAAPAGDPFQARSWEPEQPVVRRHVPPPPPQAPPLPFAYLGKMVDEGTTIVFLVRQDRNYIARLGDTLDGSYRVEKIVEEGLVLTYLPLGAEQTLPFGATPVPVSAKPKPRARTQDDEDDDE